MGYDFYNEYYHLGLFTKENLEMFVEVGFLNQADEQKIVA